MQHSLVLKQVLIDANLPQTKVAEHIGISAPSVNLLINRGIWPARAPEKVRRRLLDLLIQSGIAATEAEAMLAALGTSFVPSVYDSHKRVRTPHTQEEDIPMFLRKQNLRSDTRQAFGIHGDPFSDALPGPDAVFMGKNIRYIREGMLHTAKNGGMLAVIGESGSGKSTLRRDLIDRAQRESLPIRFIEPYVLGMEEDERGGGKTLKATHIADAILEAIAPGVRPKQSIDRKFRQVHEALKASARANYRHCLIIEEAHALAIPTLRHLKRFSELEEGFNRLLAIILIGQPELKTKLSEQNHQVREVVQRMDVLELYPLDDLQGYVEHRLKSAGQEFAKIFAPDVLDAVKERLTGPVEKGTRRGRPLWYPLAVGNVLTAALNLAADAGKGLVTGDVVRQV